MEACDVHSFIRTERKASEALSLRWGRQALRWAERTHCGP